MVAEMKLMIAEEEKFPGKALALSYTKTAISTLKEKFSVQQLQSEKHVHIDMRYLKLAKDLEEFGKYPWGAVCYAKTNASLLRALCADYQRVKVPNKAGKTKKSEKKTKTAATGRPREYHLKGFAYALQIWAYEVFPALAALHLVVHEDNAYIPRLLHWRSNSSPRFYELMSQVFENPPYWTWGDSVDDTEEFVELFGDDAEQKTSTSASVEEKDKDIDETASLPSSSKGTVASRELRTLKRDFERTKDELAKVALSNRALRDRVHQLEDKVWKESMKAEKEYEKNKKCVEDFRNTLASMEHYFKLEIEQLKKQNGRVNEAGAEVQLESFSMGADFFYRLVDETEWISSRHLDMATFLIRKRQLSHPLVFGTDWTTADCCLQLNM
ncbi:hypothetical protein L3X38_010158 [Prunus dulcis]|uniref:Uncharacterized protein n=1 Tax=Prunus dulcis TaxID=3755 RepID=A0AAD4WFV7_PRUDU|nr:hypothetical protein L3X38_010158 [Prunus dulcis]